MAKIYVLDQNYLRSEELKALIEGEPRTKFVLPDIALLEMCKGGEWKSTMERSLETLAQAPSRVNLSMSVGEALNFELTKVESIEGRLLPKDLTQFLRSIMRDVAVQSQSGPGVTLMSKSIQEVQEEIGSNELDHKGNQRCLMTRTHILKSVLGNECLREFRNRTLSDDARLAMINSISNDLSHAFLKEKNLSPNRIKNFLKKKPLVLRFYLLSIRHAFEWARIGGLENYPAEKVTNDLIDQEYVAIASFFDGIKTKEKRVNEADQDLRRLLMM